MTFLGGPPNYGRGAVLEQHVPQTSPDRSPQPVHDATFPDLNPYSYVPISQASGSAAKPAAAHTHHQNGTSNSAEPRVRLRHAG